MGPSTKAILAMDQETLHDFIVSYEPGREIGEVPNYHLLYLKNWRD